MSQSNPQVSPGNTFSPKSIPARLRDLLAAQRHPLSYFKNDSKAWKRLRCVISMFDLHVNPQGGFSLEHGPFIAGGSLVRALRNLHEVSDVDIWCLGDAQFNTALQGVTAQAAYLAQSKGWSVNIDLSKPNAPMITLTMAARDEVFSDNDVIQVQICKMPNTFNPYDVIMSFDFFAAMLATDGRTVLGHMRAFSDLSQDKFTINYDCGWGRTWDDYNLQKRIAKYERMGLTLRAPFSPEEAAKFTRLPGREVGEY